MNPWFSYLYEMYQQTSFEIQANEGGENLIRIYVKNNSDSFERTDLKVCTVDFETTWVEIKNKNSKSIM